MDSALVRSIGLLTILVILIGIWMTVANGKMDSGKDTLPGGFKSRVLAFELVRSPDDAIEILGGKADGYRKDMRDSIWKDNFFFIPAYGILYLGLAVLFARRNLPGAIGLGIAAAACGLGTVIFDIAENHYMMEVIEANPPTQELISSLYGASLIKWTFSFTTGALLSPMFLWRRDFPPFSERSAFLVAAGSIIIGLGLLVSAITGFAGLYYNPLIGRSLGLSFLGMPLLALIFLLAPRRFLEGH